MPEALWMKFTVFSAKNTAENKETGAAILGEVTLLHFAVIVAGKCIFQHVHCHRSVLHVTDGSSRPV
jgi:hypothetical protein